MRLCSCHHVCSIETRNTPQESGNLQWKTGPPHSPTPGSRAAFDFSLDITRQPASVEVARLRLDLLFIHIAIPGPGIQGNKPSDGFEPFGREFITPRSVLYQFLIVAGALEVPICRAPFPLAERGM